MQITMRVPTQARQQARPKTGNTGISRPRFGRYSFDPTGQELQDRLRRAEAKTGLKDIYSQIRAYENKMVNRLADFLQELPKLRQQFMGRLSTGKVLPNPSQGYEKEVALSGTTPQGQPYRVLCFYDRPLAGEPPRGFDVVIDNVDQGKLTQRLHDAPGHPVARLMWEAYPTASQPLQPLSVDLTLSESGSPSGQPFDSKTQQMLRQVGQPGAVIQNNTRNLYFRKDIEFKINTTQTGDDFPRYVSLNGYPDPINRRDTEYMTAHLPKEDDDLYFP